MLTNHVRPTLRGRRAKRTRTWNTCFASHLVDGVSGRTEWVANVFCDGATAQVVLVGDAGGHHVADNVFCEWWLDVNKSNMGTHAFG